MSLHETLFALPQYVLPQHALSRLMHRITRCKQRRFKNAFIANFIRLYGVNMAEALETAPDAYENFNAFFTRALKPEARLFAADPQALLCPADGAVSQIGKIRSEEIFQAKGQSYTATELLGGDGELAAAFRDGSFATIYLSPRDYHRLHMPIAGRLRQMIHVPGRLFSVNTATANSVPRLFARNERVIALFDTDAGPMALILVGAIFVASIETVWAGVVTPPTALTVRRWGYGEREVSLDGGAEMGRFNMGSTIIVLFGKDAIHWADGLASGTPVRMGQCLGRVGLGNAE